MVQTIQCEFRSRSAKADRGVAKSLGYGFVIPGGEHTGTNGVVDHHYISRFEECAGKRISRLLSQSNRAIAGFRSRTEGVGTPQSNSSSFVTSDHFPGRESGL
jgi:hypothetical protein